MCVYLVFFLVGFLAGQVQAQGQVLSRVSARLSSIGGGGGGGGGVLVLLARLVGPLLCDRVGLRRSGRLTASGRPSAQHVARRLLSSAPGEPFSVALGCFVCSSFFFFFVVSAESSWNRTAGRRPYRIFFVFFCTEFLSILLETGDLPVGFAGFPRFQVGSVVVVFTWASGRRSETRPVTQLCRSILLFFCVCVRGLPGLLSWMVRSFDESWLLLLSVSFCVCVWVCGGLGQVPAATGETIPAETSAIGQQQQRRHQSTAAKWGARTSQISTPVAGALWWRRRRLTYDVGDERPDEKKTKRKPKPKKKKKPMPRRALACS